MTARSAAIEIRGAVQGVGFRPFVYRLAKEIGLSGWVLNDAGGVHIEVDGPILDLESFIERLRTELPPVAMIDDMAVSWGTTVGFTEFAIRHSDGSGGKTALILPDLTVCNDCLREVDDPADRRAGYPFTNCTNCGPRFSIIEGLPYDRPHTTMRQFEMCDRCRAEYDDPTDRRFHAQPNACGVCGPQVSFVSAATSSVGAAAIRAAAEAIQRGAIVALKGLGGYQLLVDATDEAAVQRLRQRKRRVSKPFAVMVHDAAGAARIIDLPAGAADLLSSPQGPVVIAHRSAGSEVADGVAPGNPTLGVMVPTTPLHHELMKQCGVPVVATSGNLTDEPIAIADGDAQVRLGGIADAWLFHDRPIRRHVDDSVVWFVDGAPRLLRRARGYAPLPISLTTAIPQILAVGAHLKNTVALSLGRNVFVSQHIGDLETEEALGAFRSVISDFGRMYESNPQAVAHDAHPDYASTRYAVDEPALQGVRRIAVQHHHAHLVSCLADNSDPGPALGVTWDGTGYGPDGTVWGGEFLLGDAQGFERVAHLRPFRLPGGEAAVREPRRCAAGLLWELAPGEPPAGPGLGTFSLAERNVLATMLRSGLNAPLTTSAGRLFDGVAAMLGLCDVSTFEGEAAIALEAAAEGSTEPGYLMELRTPDSGPAVLDWRPMLRDLVADLAAGEPPGKIAARFQAGLVDGIVAVSLHVAHPKIALTGGCFQNRYLTEATATGLRARGFEVLLHRRVPPNDGGISLGQIVVAAAIMRDDEGRRP